MLKIRIRDIPASEREYRFEIDQSQLAPTLVGRDDLGFAGVARAVFFLSRIASTINMRGVISIPAKFACARCLEEYESTITIRLKIVLSKADEDSREEEDIGHGYYQGEELDLVEWGMEHISLNLPQTFLCNPDCKGLCPNCGVDLNQGSCTCEK